MKYFKIPLLLMLLSLLLAACAPSSKSPSSLDADFDLASLPSLDASLDDHLVQWEKGEFRKALADLKNVDLVDAHLLRGELFFQEAAFDEAVDELLQFLEKSPEKPLSLWALIRLNRIHNISVQTIDFDRLDAIDAKLLTPEAQSVYSVLLHSVYAKAISTMESFRTMQAVLALSEWRILGPVSTLIIPDLERQLAPDEDAVLNNRYVLSGVNIDAQTVQYPGYLYAPFMRQGIYYAETTLTLEEETTFTLTSLSKNFYTLSINGEEVLRRDIEEAYEKLFTSRSITLSEGKHRLRIKLGSYERSATPLQLYLLPQGKALTEISYHIDANDQDARNQGTLTLGAPAHLLKGFPHYVETLAPSRFHSWLYAIYAVANSEQFKAGKGLQQILSQNDQHAPALIELIERYATDPHILPALARDYAIVSAENVLERYPQSGLTVFSLVNLLMEQSPLKAGETLNKHRHAIEETLDTEFLTYRINRQLGFDRETHASAENLYREAPNCTMIGILAQSNQTRGLPTTYDDLLVQPSACDTLAEFFLREYETLTAEGERLYEFVEYLATIHPPSRIIPKYLASLMKKGHPQANSWLNSLLTRWQVKALPDHVLTEILDQLYITDEALFKKTLKDMLALDPSRMALHQINDVLFQELPLQSLRKDGMRIIKDHLAENKTYDYSAYYILDYSAYRYFDDGSSLSVTHNISRITNKEGKNLLGEVYIPPRAMVTKLHTIKADTLEAITPETITQKDSISMPQLEAGDFIEVEYFIADPPMSDAEDAFVAPAWFFQTSNAPLLHSEFIVEYPEAVEPTVQIRHAKPDIECTVEKDGFKRCRYHLADQLPPTFEPSTPHDMYLMPNMQIAYKTGLARVFTNLYNRITLSTLPSPYIEEAFQTLWHDNYGEQARKKVSDLKLAKMLYREVQERIAEKGNYFEGRASQTWNAKTGSRIGLLKALYDHAGIENEVLLVMPHGVPEVEDPLLPYGLLTPVFRVHIDKAYYYVDPSEAFAPFGFLGEELQDRPAYILSPRGLERVHTPNTIKTAYSSNVDLLLHIDNDGMLSASGKESVRGSRAILLRTAFNELKNDRDRLWRILENSMANSYGNAKISRLDDANLENTDQPFVLDYDFTANHYADITDVGLSILPGTLAFNFIQKYAYASTRQHPLVLNDYSSGGRTIKLIIPEHLQFTTEEQNIELDTPFGTYSRHTKVKGNTLTINEFTHLMPQVVHAEDYEAFRAFLKAIDDAQSAPIVALRAP